MSGSFTLQNLVAVVPPQARSSILQLCNAANDCGAQVREGWKASVSIRAETNVPGRFATLAWLNHPNGPPRNLWGREATFGWRENDLRWAGPQGQNLMMSKLERWANRFDALRPDGRDKRNPASRYRIVTYDRLPVHVDRICEWMEEVIADLQTVPADRDLLK